MKEPAERPLLTVQGAWSLSNLCLIPISIALVYARTLVDLVHDWQQNPDYSHGFVIPFAALFFLWYKRNSFRDLPKRPTNFGLFVVMASQAMLLVGYLGAEFFLQRLSLLVLLVGLVLYFHGWRTLREAIFVFALLLLAIPLPAIVFNAAALPLQLVASSWAESFLHFWGIPVYRQGNVLQLDRQSLNITEACSGIRSLVSLITAGMMAAYFLPRRPWLRVAFVLSCVPLALAANALRIGGMGLLGQMFGQRIASGFFHAFSGWVVFVSAFCILSGEWILLDRWFGRRSSTKEFKP